MHFCYRTCKEFMSPCYSAVLLEVWPNGNPKNFQQTSAKLMHNSSFGSFFVEWQNILQGQISALAGREKVSHMWSQIIIFILMFIPKALNKAIFLFGNFNKQSKCPCKPNAKLDSFPKLSDISCCHALKYILCFIILKQNNYCIVFWAFPFLSH